LGAAEITNFVIGIVESTDKDVLGFQVEVHDSPGSEFKKGGDHLDEEVKEFLLGECLRQDGCSERSLAEFHDDTESIVRGIEKAIVVLDDVIIVHFLQLLGFLEDIISIQSCHLYLLHCHHFQSLQNHSLVDLRERTFT
jgi:hypothetical protein